MTRRRRVPSTRRFDAATIDGAAELEAFVDELYAEELGRAPSASSDLDELAHALNVAIDGLSFLQHVLESHAERDREHASAGVTRSTPTVTRR